MVNKTECHIEMVLPLVGIERDVSSSIFESLVGIRRVEIGYNRVFRSMMQIHFAGGLPAFVEGVLLAGANPLGVCAGEQTCCEIGAEAVPYRADEVHHSGHLVRNGEGVNLIGITMYRKAVEYIYRPCA